MLPSAESIQIILPIVSIACLGLTFYRPVYGVISYFIILNAKLGDMYPALGAIRFEFLAAVVSLVSITLRGAGWLKVLPNKNPLNGPLWMLFIVGMISIVQAIDIQTSWANGGYPLFKLFLLYTMIVSVIQNEADLKMLVWSFILMSVWIAYEPVTNYISGEFRQQGYGRVAVGQFGAARGHVALANTLNQVLPFAILYNISQKSKNAKLILYAFVIFILLGVVMTKSRGGFLGLAFIAMGFIYISKKRGKAIVATTIIAIPLLFFAGSSYIDHMTSITEGIHGSRSAHDRYLGLKNGIDMLIKRPVMGVGIGCYAEARSRYFNYYFFSHNLYGELFGELGLCSFFWFYWIYSILKYNQQIKSTLDLSLQSHRSYKALLTGIQFSLFLRLFLGNFTHGSFFWYWFLMAGLSAGIGNLVSASISPSKTSLEMDVNHAKA